MNETQPAVGSSGAKAEEAEFSLLSMLILLARRKKLIVLLPLVVGCIAAGISMVLPSIYTARATILPPQQSQSGAAALLSQLGGVAGMAAGAAGLKNPSDLYVGMLKSRTLADKLVAKFDLKKVYNTTSQEKARMRLQSSSAFGVGKDGLISIEVEDKNQERVAQMANAYVEELLQLTKVIAITEASQRRLFYERQLGSAKNNLVASEVALKRAINTSGVISVDAESRVVVEMIGRVRAQISAKEIELNSMRSFVTENNSAFKRTQESLLSLRAELQKLENGRGGISGSDNSPSGLENIQILRDVKYYQMLYELLGKQYEIARMDEAKDSSIIQVLDPAISPEQRTRPKRAIMVLVSMAIAAILAVLWVLVTEAIQAAARSPRQAARIAELKAHIFRFR